VTEAQAGLSRQLQQQSAQIAEIGVDVTRARMGVESVEERVAKVEKSMRAAVKLLLLALLLLVTTVTLLVVRLVR
jgi:membrane protein required for beta-lactamase induction